MTEKIGLKKGTVELHPHSVEWEIEAERTLQELKSLLPHIVRAIAHVGSTSILTIKAKPIIDIALAVDSFKEILAYEELLLSHGYYYRQKNDQEEQILFAKGSFYNGTGELQTHFIHVVLTDSKKWWEYICFRDYLNEFPQIAKQYEDLKINISKDLGFDISREKYLAGKGAFIKQITAEALKYYRK